MSLFFQQWQGELLKLFARRRTYIGFAAFLALEVAILIIFRLKGVERVFERMIARQGMAFEQYYSALTLAFMILGISVVLLGAIYLALVAGDIVAKEGEDGHYRLLLVRPISRSRLLLIKYLTCMGYTFVLIQFITWSAFGLGLALKGAIEPMREKVFRNMSKRAGEMLREDMETRGPVKMSEVETAQKDMVAIARRMAEAGQITLASGRDDYVQ